MKVRWTPCMDEVIRRLYPDGGSAPVMLELGLTKDQVMSRAKRLGVKCVHGSSPYVTPELLEIRRQAQISAGKELRDTRLWFTPEMDDVIRSRYPGEGSSVVAVLLGVSVRQVQHRAGVIGVRRNVVVRDKRTVKAVAFRWTAEMDDRMRDLYPQFGTTKTAELMGMRFFQVKARAGTLGLKCSAPHWRLGVKAPPKEKPARVKTAAPKPKAAKSEKPMKRKLPIPGAALCKPSTLPKPVAAKTPVSIDMSRAVVTRAAPKPDHRFSVPNDFRGEFGSLRPGEYLCSAEV